MRKSIISFCFLLLPLSARADFWGGDLPLLAQIVTNTLHTMYELQEQTSMLHDQMAGIRDHIDRIQTIANVVQPSTWSQWRDPSEALKRLQLIYFTLPKEYRTERSDEVETEIAKAMNLISRLNPEDGSAFRSGKELERRGADASPGVAQKLTASGIGSLVSIEAQNQVVQSHIVSLLGQMLAAGSEKESRRLVTAGAGFTSVSESLGAPDNRFSKQAMPFGLGQ